MAASSFDIGSSAYVNGRRGVYEANPVVASGQGYSVSRGVTIKAAILVADVVVQRYMVNFVRKHNGERAAARIEKICSAENFVFAAGYTGVAAHNLSLGK